MKPSHGIQTLLFFHLCRPCTRSVQCIAVISWLFSGLVFFFFCQCAHSFSHIFFPLENAHHLLCFVFGSRLFYGFCGTSTKLFCGLYGCHIGIKRGKCHCSPASCLFVCFNRNVFVYTRKEKMHATIAQTRKSHSKVLRAYDKIESSNSYSMRRSAKEVKVTLTKSLSSLWINLDTNSMVRSIEGVWVSDAQATIV